MQLGFTEEGKGTQQSKATINPFREVHFNDKTTNIEPSEENLGEIAIPSSIIIIDEPQTERLTVLYPTTAKSSNPLNEMKVTNDHLLTLRVIINGKGVNFVIDSGATTNFINSTVVKKYGWFTLRKSKDLQLTLGDGKTYPTTNLIVPKLLCK